MKTTIRFMGLIGSLVCFGAGGVSYADTEFMPDELLENPPAIMKPELSDILPGFGSKFAMKFVTPGPGFDAKIMRVTPDPNIDYKIRIISPGLRYSFMGLNDLKENPPLRKGTR